MKYINIEWLKAIRDKMGKLDRNSLSTKDIRCSKEVFIDRYFKLLYGKCFKLYIKGEVYYAMFDKTTHTTTFYNKEYIHLSYGVRYHLGHNDSEYDIKFTNEKGIVKEFKLHWNDILEIKYKKISMVEYVDVLYQFNIE